MTEEELIETTQDPNNIPIVITKEFAVVLVGVLQLALRFPGFEEIVPDIFAMCEQFEDDLLAKIGEADGSILSLFEMVWDAGSEFLDEDETG
jgi:hypothetical protein